MLPTMNLTWDTESDALYIRLRDPQSVSRTVQLDAGTLVDLDRSGEAIGIQVIRPARRWPLNEVLRRWSIPEPERGDLVAFCEGSDSEPYRFRPAA
jgi:uncharacterized protein YuzE